ESCWSVMNSLGERFLYYRCDGGESLNKIRAAIANANRKTEMRAALAGAAGEGLSQECPSSLAVGDDIAPQIGQLADFRATARTPVKREGRSEEIVAVPAPEVGTRLVGQLIQLARGIAVARGAQRCDGTVLPIIHRIALSGVSRLRLELLQQLSRADSFHRTADLCQS